jgi:hypothetical protein
MSNENPISKVRKAIKGTAEVEAEQEGFSKPQEKHFKESLKFYRNLKESDHDLYKSLVETTAKGVDLHNEMGDDLYKLFNNVMEEITSVNLANAEKEVEDLKKNFSSIELSRKIYELNKRLLMKNDEDLKKDQRLIAAFSGKEDLLQRTIIHITSTMLKYLEE